MNPSSSAQQYAQYEPISLDQVLQPCESSRMNCQRTHIKIWRVSFDANLQVSALYVDLKVFCSHTSRDRHVYVDFGESLIPLVDHATVMREFVSLAWSKRFSTHRLWAASRA